MGQTRNKKTANADSRLWRYDLIMLALLGAILTGATVFVYIPQGRQLHRLESQITTEQRNHDEKWQQASVVPNLIRYVNSMKSRYHDFDRRLPKQKELAGFLREISRNLADDKLADQLIEPGKPSRQELFHTLPIIVKFKGSYLALGALLERINKMERLTRVQKLTMVPNRREPGILDVEMQLNIYFTKS